MAPELFHEMVPTLGSGAILQEISETGSGARFFWPERSQRFFQGRSQSHICPGSAALPESLLSSKIKFYVNRFAQFMEQTD